MLVVAATFPTLAAWLYFVVWAHTPWMRVLYGGSKMVQGLLPLIGWWALGMERRPAWSRSTIAPVVGLLTGAALGGTVLAAFAGPLPGWLPLSEIGARVHDRLIDLGLATPWRYLWLALGLSVAHSLFEEYYWRWFLLEQLEARMRFAAALPLASLAFAAHHWIVVDSFLGGAHRLAATLPLTLLVAFAGACWGWLLRRYGSLLPPWISHLVVDAALMTVGWRLVAPRL